MNQVRAFSLLLAVMDSLIQFSAHLSFPSTPLISPRAAHRRRAQPSNRTPLHVEYASRYHLFEFVIITVLHRLNDHSSYPGFMKH